MTQREVQDDENITWTCVQAFAGTSGEAAAEAAERVESAAGKVPVVCTPSGGKQSVRLELSRDWAEEMPDEDLIAAMEAAQ